MQRCSGETKVEEPPPLRVGAGVMGASTRLLFGKQSLELEELAGTASVELRLSRRVTLSFGLGGVYAGVFKLPDSGVRSDLHGPVASVGLSWLALEQRGRVPFVMLDATLAGSALLTSARPVYALDLRGGVTAGWSFFGWLTPYAVARVFGGPVYYSSDTGTDAYHFQLGLGVSLALPKGWDVLLEAVPLGEQRAVLALGRSF